MSLAVIERLALLRKKIHSKKIQAWVVLTGDPHLSEYLPEDWAFRKYLSGFTGSAGTLVVTETRALLWTDSRYWEQAAKQLDGSTIELMKDGAPDTPEIKDWLAANLPPSATVGVDARTISMQRYADLEAVLAARDISLVSDETLMDAVWDTRPQSRNAPVFEFTHGQTSCEKKVAAVLEKLSQLNAQALFLTSLDDIAWLTNLRGSDVASTPVFTAYALVCPTGSILYIDPKKFTDPALKKRVETEGFKIVDIRKTTCDLVKRLSGHSVLLDPATTTQALYQRLAADETVEIVRATQPTKLLKCKKTARELEFLRETMRHDGAALCELFAWLEEALHENRPVTEIEVAEKLDALRSALPGFLDTSFTTISAAGANAALPHYSPSKDNTIDIRDTAVLLIDSGGQYQGGTTDITRTIVIGEPSAALKRDFTAVLRGHIALATAVFPKGVYASQLDTFARAPLWEIGADYGHGTGHGVGFCLSVHEGPVHISPRCPANADTRVTAGLVLSNEPGLYRPGQWGIRTENLVTPVPADDFVDAMQPMMTFETLSLCPIDTRLIQTSMMTPYEIWWVNDYHRRVRESLTEFLSPRARQWLKRATEIV